MTLVLMLGVEALSSRGATADWVDGAVAEGMAVINPSNRSLASVASGLGSKALSPSSAPTPLTDGVVLSH